MSQKQSLLQDYCTCKPRWLQSTLKKFHPQKSHNDLCKIVLGLLIMIKVYLHGFSRRFSSCGWQFQQGLWILLCQEERFNFHCKFLSLSEVESSLLMLFELRFSFFLFLIWKWPWSNIGLLIYELTSVVIFLNQAQKSTFHYIFYSSIN